MWRSRWRCVIKPAYSFSFLLSINMSVWQNVLYFLDVPRIYILTFWQKIFLFCCEAWLFSSNKRPHWISIYFISRNEQETFRQTDKEGPCPLVIYWWKYLNEYLTDWPPILSCDKVRNYSTGKNKTRNVRIFVTMRSVRATIVAVEKQRLLHILCVCL